MSAPAKKRERSDKDRERDRARRAAQKAAQESGRDADAGPAAGDAGDHAGSGDAGAGGGALALIPAAGFGTVDAADLPQNIPFPGDDDDSGGPIALTPDTATTRRKPGRPRKAPAAGKSASPMTAVKTPKAPSLAKTSGALVSALFGAFAMMRGPHWRLDEEEASTIGAAFADVIGALPPGLATTVTPAIATISAPLALMAAIGAPVALRLQMEAQYHAQQAQLAAQARAQMEAPPHGVYQSPPTAQAAQPAGTAAGSAQRPDEGQLGPDPDGVQPRHVSVFAAHQQRSPGSGRDL